MYYIRNCEEKEDIKRRQREKDKRRERERESKDTLSYPPFREYQIASFGQSSPYCSASSEIRRRVVITGEKREWVAWKVQLARIARLMQFSR